MHYEITGAGPRIALLHPVGLDLTFLAPVADILSDDFTVLTVDQRGHGRSHAATQARSLEDYADDLNALFAETGFAPAALAGFSFGGMVAMTFALKYPAALRALIVCACASTQTPRRAIARARGDDAKRNGMASTLEATLDRWFTPAFRAAGKYAAARQQLLADDVHGWRAA